jgi:hypothetical protein
VDHILGQADGIYSSANRLRVEEAKYLFFTLYLQNSKKIPGIPPSHLK